MDFSVLHTNAVADNLALHKAFIAVRLNTVEALTVLRNASDAQPTNLEAAAAYAIDRLEIALSHLTHRKDW